MRIARQLALDHDALIAERPIPIHHALQSFGFAAFVEGKADAERIFPQLVADGRGRRYAAIQRRLTTLMRSQARLPADVVPYSIRHAFKDSLRLVEAPEEIQERLMGHRSPERSVARGYGSAQTANLNDWLQKIDPLDPARTSGEF